MKKILLLLVAVSFPGLAFGEITGITTQPGSSNGTVQFNKRGIFSGDASFTYSTGTRLLTVPSASISTITSLSVDLATFTNTPSLPYGIIINGNYYNSVVGSQTFNNDFYGIDHTYTGTDNFREIFVSSAIHLPDGYTIKYLSVLNVKDPPFNAVGDGSTDDTRAIKMALASASTGGIVYFPPGNYNFTGATIPSNVSIVGAGAKHSVLRYTPSSGDALFIPDRVNNISKIKIYSPNNSTGAAIKGNTYPTAVTDFTIDQYEIEGFLKGIYLPYGLQVKIGFGRIIGQGSSVVGAIGIHMGTSLGNVVVNTCEYDQPYVSQFSTGIYSICSIASLQQVTLESIKVGVFNGGRMFVNGSWIQADDYIFTTPAGGGYPITATQNFLLDVGSNEIDDLTDYVSLGGDDLAAFNKTNLVSPGPYKMRFQTNVTRGLELGSTDKVILYSSTGSLTVFSAVEPLIVDKSTGSVLIGLAIEGSIKKHIGITPNTNEFVILSSDTSSGLFSVSDAAVTTIGQNMIVSPSSFSVFGVTPSTRQPSGADLTNNVAVGGTNNTIANYTDLTTYSNDAAAIRNNLYQLSRKLKQVNDALRKYGLLD